GSKRHGGSTKGSLWSFPVNRNTGPRRRTGNEVSRWLGRYGMIYSNWRQNSVSVRSRRNSPLNMDMKRLTTILMGFMFIADPLIGGSGPPDVTEVLGAVIRGDRSTKKISLVFTGDEFGDGLPAVIRTLKAEQIQASFFLTGNFYRNKAFKKQIVELRDLGNYLGSHSDKHLLYCDWTNRDSLLVTRAEFEKDLKNSY